MSSARYIDLPTSPPTTEGEWKKAYQDILTGLTNTYQYVEHHSSTGQHRISKRDSIYIGITGISLMKFRLASSKIQTLDERLSSKTLLLSGDGRLHDVLCHNSLPTSVDDASCTSFLERPIGIAALVLSRCLSNMEREQDASQVAHGTDKWRQYWKRSIALLMSAVERTAAEDKDPAWFDEDGCEVLYGRAGLLYGLLFVRVAMQKAQNKDSYGCLGIKEMDNLKRLTSDNTIKIVVDSIVARGRHGAQHYLRGFDQTKHPILPPLMWSWHGKRYLGGAHGVVGILQMLLTSPKAVVEAYIPDILMTVNWLIDCQVEGGNWPTKALDARLQNHRRESNDLVQWCHGSPGFLILFSTVLHKSSKDEIYFHLDTGLREKLLSSLRRGASITYKQGLLRKGVGICHGVAGSVYSLLAVSGALDSTSDRSYLMQALHLAHLATRHSEFVDQGQMTIPDNPLSLYEGLAGMCCAWAEVLDRLNHPDERLGIGSGLPGYDDIL